MTTKERFERMVLRALIESDTPRGEMRVWLIGPEIVALLLREHRRTLRIVRSHMFPSNGSRHRAVYRNAVHDILQALGEGR